MRRQESVWRLSSLGRRLRSLGRRLRGVKSSWLPLRERGVATATVFLVGEWHSPWSETSFLERSSLRSQRSLESSSGQVVLRRKPDASCGSLWDFGEERVCRRHLRRSWSPAYRILQCESCSCGSFLILTQECLSPDPLIIWGLCKKIPVWVRRYRPSIRVLQADWCFNKGPFFTPIRTRLVNL